MTSTEHHEQFNRWVQEHGAMLHHVVNGFAVGADRDDLMQELLLALWRAGPAFAGRARDSTFVFRVAHYAALTWRRTQRNYRGRIERFESLTPPPEPVPPRDAGDRRELLEYIYARIRELPPVDRSLMLLHLDGVNYAHIAEIHGLTESNVGVRLNRLKRKLAVSLETIAHELR